MAHTKTPAGRPEHERDADDAPPTLMRLNKVLAQNGIASRRGADRLIEEGEVMIDGEIVTELGRMVDPDRQRIEIDGVVLKSRGERKTYYLLNKPAGVVCTSDMRENRPRAIDLIGDRNRGRIFTVGRLDEETVGLVILTNDGEFANRIGHPRYGVDKVYRAVVEGRVEDDRLGKMRSGVHLSDFRSNFDKVWVQKRSEKQSVLFIRLLEGRNREIRRVCANLGHPVKRLQRVRIGSLDDRGLKVGHWRPLSRRELDELLELAVEKPRPRSTKSRSRASKSSGPRRQDDRAHPSARKAPFRR